MNFVRFNKLCHAETELGFWILYHILFALLASYPGHDHYGIRTSDIENTEREWLNRGAVLIAEHQLANAGSIVNVRFLQLAEVKIELLPPSGRLDRGAGDVASPSLSPGNLR